MEKAEKELCNTVPGLNDGYVKDVVGGSIPGSKITLTVDDSTGENQSTVVWTEAPHDVHIHLARSSHKLGLARTAWRGWPTGWPDIAVA